MEIKNAVIESTQLGYCDHGIFTCSLQLNYGGSGQSFGNYALDQPIYQPSGERRRQGTAFGMEFIARILGTVGVETWEKLKGQHLRVRMDNCKIYAIGHFLEDKWFDPQVDLKEFAK